MPAIVSNLQSTAAEVTRGVDAAINKIDELKHAKVKLTGRAKYACQSLSIVVTLADSYVDSIDDIFYYGKESTTVDKVREEIACGQYCALQN